MVQAIGRLIRDWVTRLEPDDLMRMTVEGLGRLDGEGRRVLAESMPEDWARELYRALCKRFDND